MYEFLLAVLLAMSLVRPAAAQDECMLPVDMALVLDVSDSYTRADDLRYVKDFMKYVTNSFKIERTRPRHPQLALVTFSDSSTIVKDLDDCDNTPCFLSAIDAIRLEGRNVDINAALTDSLRRVFAPSGGDRADIEDIILLITDGIAKDQRIDQSLVAETIRRDFRVIVVAIGRGADDDILYDLATKPFYENVFFISDPRDLGLVQEEMRQLYCVAGLATPVPGPALPASCELDLALLVDTSGSITENPPYLDNWIQLRQFLRDFTRQIKFDYPSVNMALMHFRTRGNLVFGFADANGNNDVAQMDKLIKELDEPWGTTHMKTAFEAVTREVFESPANRPNIPDVLIFMTDGFPNPFFTQDPRDAAARLRNMNVRIYGIGVTANVNEEIMRSIVSPPAEKNLLPVKNYRELAYMAQRIIAGTCTEADRLCDKRKDMVVLLDLSRAAVMADEGGFAMLQRFVSNLADHLDFTEAKISLIAFDETETKLIFDLNMCNDARCVRRYVSNMVLFRTIEETNQIVQSGMVKAIEMVEYDLMRSVGDRSDAPNTILLISPGSLTLTNSIRTALDKARAMARLFVVETSEQPTYLRNFATSPMQHNVFSARSSAVAVAGFTKFLDLFCPEFDPTVPPTTVLPTTKPATVVYASDCKYDIALLVDMSRSIMVDDPQGTNFNELVIFLRLLLRHLKITYPKAYLALEHFKENAVVAFNFHEASGNTDLALMDRAIAQLPTPSGDPHMSTAFEKLRRDVFGGPGNRPDAPDVVIFITDGFTHPIQYDPRYMAQMMRDRDGVRIIGIGISSNVDENMMRAIVSTPTYDNIIKIPSFMDLRDRDVPVVDLACRKYTGTRPTPVQTPSPTPMPTVPTTPSIRDCKAPGDVIFLLDASGSLRNDNFQKMKTFTKNVIKSLPIYDGRTRVAVAQYATSVNTIFHLNRHVRNVQGIFDDVDKLEFTRGKTNTDMALAHVANTMLREQYGDRWEVPNVVVFLTDGDSSDPEATIVEARRLKQKAHVILVQLGKWVRQQRVNAVASYSPDKNVIKLDDIASLVYPQYQQRVKDRICNNGGGCGPICYQGNVVEVHGECMCECRRGWMTTRCDKVCDSEMDLMLIVDKSGSILNEEFDKQIQFLQVIAENLNFKQHRIALISYSDNPTVHLRFDDVKTKMDAINSMHIFHTKGGTNTHKALEMAKMMFQEVAPSQRKKVAILFTDGKSNDMAKTFDQAVKLKETGVYVMVVGVGPAVRERELHMVATNADSVLKLESYERLAPSLFPLISEKLCGDPCRDMRCMNGGRPIAVFNKCQCECPPGYSGIRCERGCSDKIDLGLLVDVSGSIRNERFPHVKRFLSQVVGNLTVGRDHTKVGAVSWSSSANMEFSFDQYSTTHDVVNAIGMIDFMGQRTNTMDALTIAGKQVFDPATDRPDAPNFVLMFTDGGSNINALQTVPEALRLKQQGVHITVAVVGDDMDPYELKALASEPVDENVFWAPNQGQLDDLVQRTYMSFCNDVNECYSNPCVNGGTCTDGLKKYHCTCPANLAGIGCEKSCPKTLDIVLLVDVSGSVEHVYDIVANIVKQTLEQLNVDSGNHQVGLVSYSDETKVHFYLNQHRTKRELLDSITVVRKGGKTHIARGLFVSSMDVFQQWRGDRDYAKNVLVLIADGKSSVNPSQTRVEAAQLKEKGVRIIVVVTGDLDMKEAEAIAGSPNDIVIIRDDDAIYKKKEDKLAGIMEKSQIQKGVEQLINIICL